MDEKADIQNRFLKSLEEEIEEGISHEEKETWRWKFAGMAMQAILIDYIPNSCFRKTNEDVRKNICQASVDYADLLISELLKKKKQKEEL